MKKPVALLLSIIMIMTLAACGSGAGKEPAVSSTAAPASSAAPVQTQQESTEPGTVEAAVEPEKVNISDTDFLMPSSLLYLDPKMYTEKVTDQRGVMNFKKLYVSVYFNGSVETAEKNLNEFAKVYDNYLKEQFPSGTDSHGNTITAGIANSKESGNYYSILVVFP